MARIIGIHGKRGSGKDTIANHIKTYHTRHFRSVAFADPIRAMLKAGLGLTDAHFEYPLKDEVMPEYGIRPRDLMQPLGTEFGREHLSKIPGWLLEDNLWVKRAEPMVNLYKDSGFNVLITDVRFENEAKWIREQGGEVWHITRPSLTTVDGHKSEAGVKFVKGVDKRIMNDQTLGWLLDTAFNMAADVVREEEEALEAQRQASERAQREFFNEDDSQRAETTVDVEV